MPKRTKITETIFARGISHLADDINSIEEKHRITPADLTRGLLEAACAFYREHGFFSFPVRIEPEAFQKQWIAASPEQDPYHPARILKASLDAAKDELRKKDRADEAARKRRRANQAAAQ